MPHTLSINKSSAHARRGASATCGIYDRRSSHTVAPNPAGNPFSRGSTGDVMHVSRAAMSSCHARLGILALCRTQHHVILSHRIFAAFSPFQMVCSSMGRAPSKLTNDRRIQDVVFCIFMQSPQEISQFCDVRYFLSGFGIGFSAIMRVGLPLHLGMTRIPK